MSVICQFAMFPTDKGESLGVFVSRIVDVIDRSNVAYKLTPMSTIIETDTLEEALSLIKQSYKQLEEDCNRVYASVTIDIRKGKSQRLLGKISSLESRLGKKVKT